MGDAGKDALRVGCTTWTLGSDRAIKLEFHGASDQSLDFVGRRYIGARKTRRRSRAKVIWEI